MPARVARRVQRQPKIRPAAVCRAGRCGTRPSPSGRGVAHRPQRGDHRRRTRLQNLAGHADQLMPLARTAKPGMQPDSTTRLTRQGRFTSASRSTHSVPPLPSASSRLA